jgi:hypothetical protein
MRGVMFYRAAIILAVPMDGPVLVGRRRPAGTVARFFFKGGAAQQSSWPVLCGAFPI